MPKVSVVIPIYNVEAYIERCLHSLFGQTLDDIEYVFVDDCTPDGSVSILERVLEQYLERREQTKILRHDRNRGLAAARATGIHAATGEYIIQCDSDDWVERDMYEKMYSEAVRSGADIVTCYHWLNDREVKYDFAPTPQECLANMYLLRCRYVHVWSKLVRRSIVEEHDITPFEGIDFGEDLNTTVRLLYWAQTISVVREPLYHYCIREESLSTSRVQLDNFGMRVANADRVSEFLEHTGEKRYRALCSHMKFSLKFEFRNRFADDREWFDWYRECHRDIMKFSDNSLKSRVILRVALHNYTLYRLFSKGLFPPPEEIVSKWLKTND